MRMFFVNGLLLPVSVRASLVWDQNRIFLALDLHGLRQFDPSELRVDVIEISIERRRERRLSSAKWVNYHECDAWSDSEHAHKFRYDQTPNEGDLMVPLKEMR